MIAKFFEFIVAGVVSVVGFFFDALFGGISSSIMPPLQNFADMAASFYTYTFGYLNWLRDCLMIDNTSMHFIIDTLTIKFLVRPVLALIKIVINWIKELL